MSIYGLSAVYAIEAWEQLDTLSLVTRVLFDELGVTLLSSLLRISGAFNGAGLASG